MGLEQSWSKLDRGALIPYNHIGSGYKVVKLNVSRRTFRVMLDYEFNDGGRYDNGFVDDSAYDCTIRSITISLGRRDLYHDIHKLVKELLEDAGAPSDIDGDGTHCCNVIMWALGYETRVLEDAKSLQEIRDMYPDDPNIVVSMVTDEYGDPEGPTGHMTTIVGNTVYDAYDILEVDRDSFVMKFYRYVYVPDPDIDPIHNMLVVWPEAVDHIKRIYPELIEAYGRRKGGK